MGQYIMLRHKKSQHYKNVISQSVNSKENPIKLPIELFPELNKLILNSVEEQMPQNRQDNSEKGQSLGKLTKKRKLDIKSCSQ